ncbi:hypothetical protein N5T79_06530 [Aliarcobacter cryaerophilus]|uniref:hypothetical protein n=1 Tax=Aliarcobacter cryaerophilus TaxID=28198 RepID=UPI0021B55366|nr:hypothetical protein [Aliarcobacter cryaerophilus]MCT7528798.1 hypothetical protein [Aliarcobacter cryaerophilus]
MAKRKNSIVKIRRLKDIKIKIKTIKYIKLAKKYKDWDWFNHYKVRINISEFKLKRFL